MPYPARQAATPAAATTPIVNTGCDRATRNAAPVTATRNRAPNSSATAASARVALLADRQPDLPMSGNHGRQPNYGDLRLLRVAEVSSIKVVRMSSAQSSGNRHTLKAAADSVLGKAG